jgi:glycosyltransferase involved in cell wall biosynthesis
MAAARPFVSTAVGGVASMVSGPVSRGGDGCAWYSNAVLVDPRPAAFAHALARLSDNRNLLAAMGSQARTLALTHYTKETLTANLHSLYRELIQRKLAAGITARPQVAFSRDQG